jgi:ribosomal-protein-alanine N-acetyltransferase
MTPQRMAEIHAAAFAGRGDVWSETEIAEILRSRTTAAVTVADDGFALLQIVGPEAEILTLAVDTSVRGRGLGTILVQRAMARAVQDGVETVFLEVADDNAAARALYAAAGFTQIGRRPGYYARDGHLPADALVLTRACAAEKTGSAPEG